VRAPDTFSIAMGIVPSGRAALPRLESAALPGRFLAALGERAALLGREEGVFEAWIWPIKVLHDLRFALSSSPARSERTVVVRPDGFELREACEAFEFALEVFASPERAALVFLPRLVSGGPLELECSFRSDFRPMWPAGLGGQLARVDPETGAFSLSEELGRFACLVGAPGARVATGESDHALPRGPVAIRVALQPGTGVPFVIAGAAVEPAELSEDARRGAGQAATGFSRARAVLARARELWRELAGDPGSERRGAEERWRGFLARTARIETPERALDEAFTWSQLAIERSWVDVEGLGRGLVAGFGESRGGERPGFAWFFDGDALAAARALTGTGDFEGAREVLRFAAAHQRADGKLMHELTLSARLCRWLEDYPYAYYKGINTPEFVSALEHYVAGSGDLALARELWPAAERALEWCASALDERGRLSNAKAGLAAVEAGPLADPIASEIFLHGAWASALASAIRLAGMTSQPAERWSRALVRAREALEGFWSRERDHYAFAFLGDGSRQEDLSAYTALALARGVAPDAPAEHAWATAQALNEPRLASDWGARMFARDSSVYDPASYNTGAVFPYLTNFVTLAEFLQGHALAAHPLFFSQVALVHAGGLGLLAEHLEGERLRAPERSVPHQVFSSAALLESALFGLFGLQPDASRARLRVAPCLPPAWGSAALRNARVGDTRFDLEFRSEGRGSLHRIALLARKHSGPELWLRFAPVLPPLTRVRRDCELRPSGAVQPHLAMKLLEDEIEFALEVELGPSVELPFGLPPWGEESRNPRCVRQEVAGEVVTWTLAGRAGSRASLPFACDRQCEVSGASLEHGRLALFFPRSAADAWTTAVVSVACR